MQYLKQNYIRAVLIAAGIIFIIISLLADTLELDSSDKFGSGERLLLFSGVLLLFLAFAGKKIIDYYKYLAIVLLNTVLLLFLVEIAITASFTLGIWDDGAPGKNFPALPYYDNQPWAAQYWNEHWSSDMKRYEPYVDWRRRPFQGKYVKVDSLGIRHTPGNPPAHENAYQVFAFGGSTMWGWGAPDSLTIPALLRNSMANHLDRPVHVTNYGEDSYISSQGVSLLIRQLQEGHIPDLVIFYDGVNDVASAFVSGQANRHQYIGDITAKIDSPPILRLIKDTQTFQWLQGLVAKPQNPPAISPTLSREVVQAYLNNYRIVENLAQTYGFDFYFFWQPMIFTGKKPLSDVEKAYTRRGKRYINFNQSIYQQVNQESQSRERMLSITDVFDDVNETLYIDQAHINPIGNRLVASRILQEILPVIPPHGAVTSSLKNNISYKELALEKN